MRKIEVQVTITDGVRGGRASSSVAVGYKQGETLDSRNYDYLSSAQQILDATVDEAIEWCYKPHTSRGDVDG